MAALRKIISIGSLILVAILVPATTTGVLLAFPAEPLVWQAATWTLVAALIGLLVLVTLTGYALATGQAARAWQRVASFLIGLACLAPLPSASFRPHTCGWDIAPVGRARVGA